MITHLSLFSGIGGLDLAAEAAGITTIGQCEWGDYQTKILEKHWPDTPRWRDIHTLTGESFHEKTGLRTVDVVSGGFPCQPFSVAGKQRGTDDDRYLWPEMLRVILELRPSWVIGENVPGIINLALDEVLADLEANGYEVQAFDIPACGVDAPHKRERIAIVAHAIDGRCTVRRHGEHADADCDGESGADHTRGADGVSERQRRQDKPGTARMVDGIRSTVHKTDSDPDVNGYARRLSEQVLAAGEREREREREKRGYDGLLRSLAEVTPLGRLGPLNPKWVEWLMGYTIGWTESHVSEEQ